MKISKLFHWLYAILMFMPFALVITNTLALMLSGGFMDGDSWYNYVWVFTDDFVNSGASLSISVVYNYLVVSVFGFLDSSLSTTIVNLLTYWTCISIIWLVFDVFMYVPLLVHRWIDKAKIE